MNKERIARIDNNEEVKELLLPHCRLKYGDKMPCMRLMSSHTKLLYGGIGIHILNVIIGLSII
ncbi:MAG: hypothetical protein GH144_05005 [Clostridia bacterium]|jgi:hypothetical protein|nr:hypothetical protein [Clostridia bacterium]